MTTDRRSFDVVVIGGGVNGVSTAFHLARAGAGKVIVLERRHLAAGATGKSGALVRMHYTNEPEARLAFESLKVFRDFDAIVGGDCGFRPVGFVQIVGPGYERALAHNVAMQQRVGIETSVVTPEELRRLIPEIRVDGVGAAAWEPGSGFADPNATTFAFAAAARRLGVTIETGREVTAITHDRGRATGVETDRGPVASRCVVVAAGAWAQRLLAPLGLDWNLTPFRIQVSIFRWPPGFTPRHPAVIDATQHSWMRPEGDASTLIGVELGVGHANPDDYDEGVDGDFVARSRPALAARFPAFATSTMRGGWAGMIMMSPDGRPVIDGVAAIGGLYVVAGDSGTSFKTAPAIGRCLAEWIVEGKPRTADLTPFRSTRFAEGPPWVDAHPYGPPRPLSVSR